MNSNQLRQCPACGIEVTEQSPHCPRCNAVINVEQAAQNEDPTFPTLDENSGRVEPETLPPYSTEDGGDGHQARDH